MIAALAVRPARGRRTPARRDITWESRAHHASPARRPARPARRGHALPRLGIGGRLFVLSAGMLATAFLTALLYLRFATSIAAGGYDLQALQQRRDEVRRQNDLLQLQLQRLDAPARIEAEAQRLGLVKSPRTLFLTAGPSVTRR